MTLFPEIFHNMMIANFEAFLTTASLVVIFISICVFIYIAEKIIRYIQTRRFKQELDSDPRLYELICAYKHAQSDQQTSLAKVYLKQKTINDLKSDLNYYPTQSTTRSILEKEIEQQAHDYIILKETFNQANQTYQKICKDLSLYIKQNNYRPTSVYSYIYAGQF